MSKKYFSWKWIVSCTCVLFLAKCKVPYDAPVQASNSHYLVVEGYLNGNGTTTIKLSRTRNITWGDTASYINETGAHLEIQDENNNTMPLNETGNGIYSGNYNLYPGNKYRLHITTTDHKEYLSDYVPYKQSPPIDTIGWNFKDGGVQIYANTHDPQNNTRYYRWSYEETWEFHSQYYSRYVYNPANSTVVPRIVPVYVCYRDVNSSTIILGSSAKLEQDVIHEAPILLIPDHDNRISVLYSILVTQYALDSSAYNYWSAMKSNTENVGSIFDPQPNQTRGNIHSVSDPTETVIGYIGAESTEQQRVFINNSELPSDWNQPPNCLEYIVPNIRDSLVFYFGVQGFIPYSEYPPGAFIPKGYYSAQGPCVDCTLSGGSLVKPSFWP